MLSRLALGLGLLLLGIVVGRQLAKPDHRVRVRLAKNEKRPVPERLGPPATKIVVH
ncbi:hypothetical protein SVA_0744 [Sulfurifustis variabilis]|uniref:Uncharacterized protein n=1 Tax=Sulfurifustis variabilis TaxID=1675686 RepID=A0A1B4V1M9_9GAMM|nr:hypothetical protein [Sulfurifustis variabilis]BAU47323.1 hypothetical protein SVA_0744 [Sulfurifustis variabilis]